MEYVVAEAPTVSALTNIVRNLIRGGWEPQGGINGPNPLFQQAMVKE